MTHFALLEQTLLDCIKDATQNSVFNGIPNGHLYTMVMSAGISFATYVDVIDSLKIKGQIKETNFLLEAL